MNMWLEKSPTICEAKDARRAGGVEPAHPKIQDFESSASANSAIRHSARVKKDLALTFFGCCQSLACAEAEECR